jgi:hypothetical protein
MNKNFTSLLLILIVILTLNPILESFVSVNHVQFQVLPYAFEGASDNLEIYAASYTYKGNNKYSIYYVVGKYYTSYVYTAHRVLYLN